MFANESDEQFYISSGTTLSVNVRGEGLTPDKHFQLNYRGLSYLYDSELDRKLKLDKGTEVTLDGQLISLDSLSTATASIPFSNLHIVNPHFEFRLIDIEGIFEMKDNQVTIKPVNKTDNLWARSVLISDHARYSIKKHH